MSRRRAQEKFPSERSGLTHHFVIYAKGKGEDAGKIVEVDGYFTFNRYPDGRIGEIFLRCGKEGEETAMLDMWAIAMSFALQYGAPLEELCRKFVGMRFEPSGATKNRDIPRCTSPVDYVARYLLARAGVVVPDAQV